MNLAQHLNTIKNRIGLVSGSLKISEYDDADQNITAAINPQNWQIEFSIKKGYEPIQDKRQKAYARKKKISDAKKTLLEDLLHHELAHWELPFNSGFGCPFDTYHHDLILEAIKKALPENKQSLAGYVANAFEDTLINPRVKEFKGDFSGQVLFWDDQGAAAQKQGRETYTPFYEAFVKLNMHLFGDNADGALLKRHYSNAQKVDEAVQKTIAELNLPENIQNTPTLFIKQQWPGMAAIFAKSLADLLETPPTERLSAFSAEADSAKTGQQPAGNGIEQKASTKEGKEEIAYGRYKSNNPPSPNISNYEQLDALYRRLAKALPVNVEAMTRRQSLAIAPLNYRPFDPETDDMGKIKLTKLYAAESGRITFGYERSPVTVIQKSKIQKRSFPEFKMIILDNSGSMQEGLNGNQGNTAFIPWGDNSKYHYALLGFYGIEQFLQAQGIAQYIGHGLSLFSSSTRYKESDFKNIHELRKLALSPEFGNTKINVSTLVDALRGKESFVLSLSDGQIQNWDQVKQEFGQLAARNYFAHIQIGQPNQFTHDLESNKLPVFYVASGEELSKLMVKISTDTYKRLAQQ